MEISGCIASAAEFLKQHGRQLDISLYLYHCENGPKDSVLKSLVEYQNSDGGFGRALEPDVRMQASSVLATTVAFQLMRPLNLSAKEGIVRSGIAYFLQTFDHDEGGWQVVPPNVSEAPHAPWWQYKPDVQQQWANPRAEILGYLYEYQAITPPDLRDRLLADILTRLASAETLEMHEVQCFVRLLEAPNLPASAAETIMSRLLAMLPDVVELNPDKWNGYCLRPLDVVSSPYSPLFKALEPGIASNIEYLIQQQHPDGYWSPAWSWAFVNARAWQQALVDLRSLLTLNNVLRLRALSSSAR